MSGGNHNFIRLGFAVRHAQPSLAIPERWVFLASWYAIHVMLRTRLALEV
ncbi:Unknown protein sequence [Pseudomonas syringae pv. cerasicola]|uniref:Uncharacterized protein n=1 Tax=Pseudomonas syringae pv. cerasicola TaxID=264451 RepID=A0A0P9NYX9_PSESX|nr:Unknown protein sequence [Pseudomonas syringae pv. cerasicola]